MTRIALLMAVLLSSPALGEEPDEVTKRAALLLAYELNGGSMVRWGSIDLSGAVRPQERIIPLIVPPKKGIKQ